MFSFTARSHVPHHAAVWLSQSSVVALPVTGLQRPSHRLLRASFTAPSPSWRWRIGPPHPSSEWTHRQSRTLCRVVSLHYCSSWPSIAFSSTASRVLPTHVVAFRCCQCIQRTVTKRGSATFSPKFSTFIFTLLCSTFVVCYISAISRCSLCLQRFATNSILSTIHVVPSHTIHWRFVKSTAGFTIRK